MTHTALATAHQTKRREVLLKRFSTAGFGVVVERSSTPAPGAGNWNTAGLVVTLIEADVPVEFRYTDSMAQAVSIAEALLFEHGRRRTAS